MSLNWNERYQPWNASDTLLRPMTPHDIPGATFLCHQIGWLHNDQDWERLLHWSPDGCFVLEETDRGIIGTVSTVTYGDELAWIGMLLVAPDRQRQGLGRQLMRAALDHLIARDVKRIMLDSTEAGRPLYNAMGFRTICKIERWEGRASTYLGPRARRLRPQDHEAVFALDRALFGLDRRHILARLLEEFPDLAWVDSEGGRIEGFLLGRRFGQAICLGPWMSLTLPSARKLLLIAFEQLQGAQVILNIPDSNGRSLILASDHNLKRVRQCTRMIYADAEPIRGDPLGELAVTSMATG